MAVQDNMTRSQLHINLLFWLTPAFSQDRPKTQKVDDMIVTVPECGIGSKEKESVSEGLHFPRNRLFLFRGVQTISLEGRGWKDERPTLKIRQLFGTR